MRNPGARTSILAGVSAPRPDTLTQTDQITLNKPLADGAGHTCLNDSPRRATADHIAPLLNRTACSPASQLCSAASVISGWAEMCVAMAASCSGRQLTRPVTAPRTGAHLPGQADAIRAL